MPRPLALACLLLLAVPAAVAAKTSHAGWPVIDGVLRMDKDDSGARFTGPVGRHNELLGGHGDDVLQAGDIGDVLWGDYKPSGQPTTQHDTLRGGAGKDFIYAGHGTNTITSGGGADQIHAHFGRGTITCANAKPTVFLSHRSRRRYVLHGCRTISYFTRGS